MATTTSPMAGYTVVKAAAQQVAEMDTAQTSFEIWDVSKGTKEILDTTPAPKKKPTRSKKSIAIQAAIEAVNTPPDPDEQIQHVADIVAEYQKDSNPFKPERELEDIVFVTPYVDTTIGAIEIYRDSTVFSVVTPADDRVKVRPKRGATLEVICRGETINLYSSGVYVPITELDAILSVFFIVPDNQEE